MNTNKQFLQIIIAKCLLFFCILFSQTMFAQKGFVVFEKNDPLPPAQKFSFLGWIEIKKTDGDLPVRCDYKSVLDIVRKRAIQKGANAIQIVQHRKPRHIKECHFLKAKAYKMTADELWKYEKEIVWNGKRKLERRNFKGDTLNKSFEALTHSIVRFNTNAQRGSRFFTLKVETVFLCNKSYFKSNHPDENFVLKHEQCHFDLAEVYARLFVREVRRKVKNAKSFQKKHRKIFKSLMEELDALQKQYDYEVRKDPLLHEKWFRKAEEELKMLEAYRKKEIKIPMR